MHVIAFAGENFLQGSRDVLFVIDDEDAALFAIHT
jgi:hypothetical protein